MNARLKTMTLTRHDGSVITEELPVVDLTIEDGKMVYHTLRDAPHVSGETAGHWLLLSDFAGITFETDPFTVEIL